VMKQSINFMRAKILMLLKITFSRSLICFMLLFFANFNPLFCSSWPSISLSSTLSTGSGYYVFVKSQIWSNILSLTMLFGCLALSLSTLVVGLLFCHISKLFSQMLTPSLLPHQFLHSFVWV